MLEAGIINPSESPLTSSIVVVSKKNGERRIYCDFRKLNSVTRMTSFPLKTVPEVLDQVAEQIWSSIDLKSGYWHPKLDPRTADKPALKKSLKKKSLEDWYNT